MSLDSKFKLTQFSLCRYSCFLVGFFGFATGLNAPSANGQQVYQQQGTVIQQQPIYQTPTYQPPIYQGPSYYQGPGQIVPQQPLPPGPTYQVPNGVIDVPPPTTRVPQPDNGNAQPAIDAETANFNAEKLAVVEKLLEKYKALAAENQDMPAKLELLKQENTQLSDRMGELNQTNNQYQTEVATLREKLAAAAKPDQAGMQEVEQLKTSYRESVSQVQELETRLQTLTGDNRSYQDQIAKLKAAAMNSSPDQNNQAELTKQNQALTQQQQTLMQEKQAIEDKYSMLNGQFQTLEEQRRKAEDNNQLLNDRISELRTSNEGYISEIASFKAKPQTPPPAVPATPEVIPSTEVALTQPTVDLTPYESRISKLTLENQQLVQSNGDFKAKNRSLKRELTSLKSQSSEVAVSGDSPNLTAAVLPAAVTDVVPAAKSKGGWGILGWLIPFLAIGLGVAFFVIMKEELHRAPNDSVARHDHNG